MLFFGGDVFFSVVIFPQTTNVPLLYQQTKSKNPIKRNVEWPFWLLLCFNASCALFSFESVCYGNFAEPLMKGRNDNRRITCKGEELSADVTEIIQ